MAKSEPTETISTFRLRRRTPGTFVLVPAERLGRSIRCQGQLEAAAAQILVASPLVDSILEQPLQIHYAWREDPLAIRLLDGPPKPGSRRAPRTTYIVPDFLVEMRSGAKRLVEIKPSAKLEQPIVARKLAVGRLFAAANGWSFHVVTERELYQVSLLSNVRLLGRFHRLAADAELLEAIEARVQQSPTTIAQLEDELTRSRPDSQIQSSILHLVAIGQLDADLQAAPLTQLTTVHPRGTFPWDPFDSAWAPSGSSTDAPSEWSVS